MRNWTKRWLLSLSEVKRAEDIPNTYRVPLGGQIDVARAKSLGSEEPHKGNAS